jgi:hypothetical protein
MGTESRSLTSLISQQRRGVQRHMQSLPHLRVRKLLDWMLLALPKVHELRL